MCDELRQDRSVHLHQSVCIVCVQAVLPRDSRFRPRVSNVDVPVLEALTPKV